MDDKEYKDSCLITLLNNAEAFIRNNSRTPWTIRGMRREENSDYPFKAVRVVLVNALIHRDYQIIGTEVHVDIFDDRLEIISPGGMMNGNGTDASLYVTVLKAEDGGFPIASSPDRYLQYKETEPGIYTVY